MNNMDHIILDINNIERIFITYVVTHKKNIKNHDSNILHCACANDDLHIVKYLFSECNRTFMNKYSNASSFRKTLFVARK